MEDKVDMNKFEVEGDGFFCHEQALAELLHNDVMFCNSFPYSDDHGGKIGDKIECAGITLVCFLGCNDVFAWACADAECVEYHELEQVWRAWKADPHYGTDKWVCIKRNQKPQKPLEEMMRAAGVWDDQMEALPDNTMDAEIHAQMDALCSNPS